MDFLDVQAQVYPPKGDHPKQGFELVTVRPISWSGVEYRADRCVRAWQNDAPGMNFVVEINAAIVDAGATQQHDSRHGSGAFEHLFEGDRRAGYLNAHVGATVGQIVYLDRGRNLHPMLAPFFGDSLGDRRQELGKRP